MGTSAGSHRASGEGPGARPGFGGGAATPGTRTVRRRAEGASDPGVPQVPDPGPVHGGTVDGRRHTVVGSIEMVVVLVCRARTIATARAATMPIAMRMSPRLMTFVPGSQVGRAMTSPRKPSTGSWSIAVFV